MKPILLATKHEQISLDFLILFCYWPLPEPDPKRWQIAKEEQMKRLLFALASGLALLAAMNTVAGPRVDADPNKLYPITPDVGPWVICAASYTGPDARELARQTIYQLRRRDNMPAYFFDYSAEERRQMESYLQDLQRPELQRRKAHVRVQDQCGVLIGGYPDDQTARKALNDVKKLKIPELDLGANKVAYDTTVGPDGRRMAFNPFANAFVTRNPSVPRDQQQQGTDPFLKQLNEGEQYSLLKNPRPWTLAIKSFYGVSVINSSSASGSFLDKLWPSHKTGDVLDASARTAHEMADVLRQLHFDAWVLHRRKDSVVTVGGFDDPRDPKIQETIAQLAKLRERNIKENKGTDPLQLPTVPLPMRVPKL
jgi:hypothetical protein